MTKKELTVRSPKLRDIYESIPESRPAMKRRMESYARGKRGRATRGWAAAAPTPGKERQELYHKCSPACFLDPENLKYPICPALRVTKGECVVSPRGVRAAKVRASQWHHPEIVKKANRILRLFNAKIAETKS